MESEVQIISELSKIVEQAPNAENYINLAKAYYKLDEPDYENAIINYSLALKYKNCPKEAYYYRGIVYLRKKDNKNALKDLKTAAKLLPSIDTYFVLGNMYRLLEKYKQALKIYSKLIKFKSYMPAYKYRADCYYEICAYKKAIKDYSVAIEAYPQDEDLYNYRAFAYWQIKNKLKNVISDFTKILEINPKNLKAYTDRGYAYFQNKEYEKSIQDYKKFIELKETGAGDDSHDSFLDINFAYGYIGVNQEKLRQYDEAINNILKAVNQGEKFTMFNFSLAICYFAKKCFKLGILNYIKAIKYYFSDVILHKIDLFIYKFKRIFL